MYFVSVLEERERGGGRRGKEERIYLWIDWIDNAEIIRIFPETEFDLKFRKFRI